VLFADGDQTYDLIVVLEGRVEVVEDYGTRHEQLIVAYGPRQFVGEIACSPASGRS